MFWHSSTISQNGRTRISAHWESIFRICPRQSPRERRSLLTQSVLLRITADEVASPFQNQNAFSVAIAAPVSNSSASASWSTLHATRGNSAGRRGRAVAAPPWERARSRMPSSPMALRSFTRSPAMPQPLSRTQDFAVGKSNATFKPTPPLPSLNASSPPAWCAVARAMASPSPSPCCSRTARSNCVKGPIWLR